MSIAATGNFGFFNLLSAVLGLSMLKDSDVLLWAPHSVLRLADNGSSWLGDLSVYALNQLGLSVNQSRVDVN